MDYDSDIESDEDSTPDHSIRDESAAEDKEDSLSARPYQVELLNKALERNIVVCLGTGTGKTFISVLLIKELAHQIRKDYEDDGKRTFFLVNTVPLVTQQYRVIDQNTDLSVGKYVGEDGVDFWDKGKWLKEIKKYQVLVMTAQIFVDMLGHGKIPLSKVNLIVFDECHHAKKEHPYAQVMRYFPSCNSDERPKVLGLTASIVNGKVKPQRIEQEIRTLEATLRATCETSSDELVGQYATKPTEYSHPYSTSEDVSPQEKKLIEQLYREVLRPWDEFLNDVRDKSDFMKFSKSIVKECIETLDVLGASAANRVAEYFLEVTERFSKTRLLSSEFSDWLMEYNSTQLRQLQKIYKNYKTLLYGATNGGVQHVSAKVKALVEILKQYGTDPKTNNLCGIVFVQRRCTAAVLCEQLNLLSQQDEALSFVKCEYVVGHGTVGTSASSAKDMSCKKQDKVLRKFRNHEFNLLIATSVVEEGLDVPKCNLVVRFDFPMTFQSYVQSKGRARAKDSFYIMLLPDGQDTVELEMYQAIEEYLSQVCYDRRPPTEEESNEAVDTDLLPPYRTEKGACVRMANSIALLCKYCSKLPGDRFTPINPDYKTVEVGKDAFQTTLTLPINCPIKEKIAGDAMPRKQQAKMAAAYAACIKLHEIGELDDNLFPVESLSDESEDEDQDVEMVEAGQPKSGTKRKKQVYPRKVPAVFQGSLPTGSRDRCYLYAFTKCHDKATDHSSVEEEILKLGILMKEELPAIRRFILYPDDGPVTVSVKPIAKSQRLSTSQLSLIDRFHAHISSGILRSSFERQTSDGYYIVPLKTTSSKKSGSVQIDFDRAKNIVDQEKVVGIRSLEEMKEGDSIITPMHRPKEKFIVEEICTHLSPMSAFPEQSKAKTYEEYFRKEYPSLERITKRDQPLILVKSMPQRINFLVDRKKIKSKEKPKKDIHFIPELCTLEQFSAQLLLEARELPSILHRMTSILLVMEMRALIAEGCRSDVQKVRLTQDETELPAIGGDTVLRSTMVEIPVTRNFPSISGRDRYNKEFELVSKHLARLFSNSQLSFLHPDSALLLQALTTKGAGDAFDLERLEMLGDAFLKQAVSIYLFCFYTNKDEGKLTRRKVKQISNLKLYKVSTAHHLPGYMQTTILDRKSWAPPCLHVTPQETAKMSQEPNTSKKRAKRQKLDSEAKQEDFTKQTISDKSVADSIEALIGAYLVSDGYKGALYFLDYLGIKVLPDQDTEVPGSPSNYASFLIPPCDPLSSSRLDDLDIATLELQGFEHRIEYEFRNKIYLLQALTHASYAYNRLTPDCYQRLEFLGDAVLDFVVTECLYSKNQRLSPGELTDLRQALVNNNIFAKIAVEYGYHLYLKQTSPEWFKKVGDFVQKLQDDEDDGKPKISDDPFLIMSDKDDEAVEAPKVLGDIFESVAGAIFLDSGMDVVVTWKVYYRMMKPYIEYYSANVPYNPVRLVHENDSELKFSDARVLDDGKIECDLEVSWGRFTGRGANKRIAKAAASRRAMEELKRQKAR